MGKSNKIDVERAAALWADGLTIKDMAIYFDVNPRSMANLIHSRRASFPHRGTSGMKVADVPDGSELAEMNKTRSLRSIADEFGVTVNTITGRIRRARLNGTLAVKAVEISAPVAKPKKEMSPDRVVRRTTGGALVTLYRVPSVDGSLEAAE